MLILHVHIHIKPEFADAFLEATLENARNSRQEPGVVRFDVLRQSDDPTRFVLNEVYRSEEGLAAHRTTLHYAKWQQTAEPMMAEPRSRTRLENIFPGDDNW